MTTRTQLEDGWGADTPVGDTLLRRYLFNLAAFHESVATAMGGRTLRRDDVVAADLGRPAGYYNSAVLLQPPARTSRSAECSSDAACLWGVTLPPRRQLGGGRRQLAPPT